jgi:hypothetical protein
LASKESAKRLEKPKNKRTVTEVPTVKYQKPERLLEKEVLTALRGEGNRTPE